MADDINKKITIDIEVKSDGQQQIDQYNASFDDLRSTISNLGKPLSDLSGNITSLDKDISKFTDTISKLNTQNQAVATSGNRLKDTFKDLTGTFSAWKSIVNAAELASEGWAGVLAGALTIITNYGPAILDWISNLTKSNNTLSALSKTLKDKKIIMDAINQAQNEGNVNAQQELVHLKLLYAASQDKNLSLKDRKKIINELRSEYPGYFNNLSDEAIMAGKATNAYNNLSASIIATSRARAAENMMVKNQERQLGNDNSISELTTDLNKYQKELDKANKQYNDYLKGFGTKKMQGAKFQQVNYKPGEITDLEDKINKIKQDLSHLDTDSKLLEGQNKVLANKIIADTRKNGAIVLGITQNNNEQQNKATRSKIKKNEQIHKYTQAQLQQFINQGYASDALAANQHYTDEKQKLDQALKDKLISLDDYYKKAEALQNDYHASIADIINKVDNTGQRGQMLPEPKGTNALDPSAYSLDAGIKIKTDYDIANTKTTEEKKLEIKKTALQKAEDYAKKNAANITTNALSALTKSIQAQSDAKVQALEKDKARELSNSNLTSAQKAAIEAKYKKQEGAVKAKAFKQQQEISIAQAVINGAIAITKSEADLGPIAGTIAIAAVVAETALQVATIAKQKPPAYSKGGLHYQSDGRGGVLSGYSRSDNTNAYLRSGEGIVVSEAMQVPWARNLVSAVNVGFGGRDFSAPVSTRGFAVGGIFTDGGNANRYYNQPVNDQKNLANTVAYQMINNFPPVYVDVKDVNNQQNILAQTVNRVNL